MSTLPVISVVDNDESVRTAVSSLLRAHDYTVNVYESAFAFLDSEGPVITACLVSDIQMPGMCGTQMYEELAARGIHIPTIFITGNPGAPPVLNPIVRRPEGYFSKPFQAGELIACIEKALHRAH